MCEIVCNAFCLLVSGIRCALFLDKFSATVDPDEDVSSITSLFFFEFETASKLI